MFTSVAIKNFRCLADVTVAPLGRVNLIAGANNVGKTALLEAILLLLGGMNVAHLLRINVIRGLGDFSPGRRSKKTAKTLQDLLWTSLFLNLNNKVKIQISGVLHKHGRIGVELQVLPATLTRGPVMQLAYTDPSAQTCTTKMRIDSGHFWFKPSALLLPLYESFLPARQDSSLLRVNAERLEQLAVDESLNLLKAVQIVEPRLQRLSKIVGADNPMIYGDIGLIQPLPLSYMGDGLERLTSVLLAITDTPAGTILVDEIENGLHHSTLPKVWQAIAETTREYGIQVLATTHSLECIQAAHQAFASEKDEFRLHRLERVAGKIEAVTYDQETLDAAMKAGMEVR